MEQSGPAEWMGSVPVLWPAWAAQCPAVRVAVSPARDASGARFDLRHRNGLPTGLLNRLRFAQSAGLGSHMLIVPNQTHSARVAVIGREGPGADGLAETDAVCTGEAGYALMVQSADCGVIGLVDIEARAVGVAHAGWRGTAGRIVQELVATMQSRLGARAARMWAFIGPCAGSPAYEVGEDVAEAVAGLPGAGVCLQRRSGVAGKYALDLAGLNRAQLEEAGVRPERIDGAGECTISGSMGFFSHRREGAGAGRFGLVAGLVG